MCILGKLQTKNNRNLNKILTKIIKNTLKKAGRKLNNCLIYQIQIQAFIDPDVFYNCIYITFSKKIFIYLNIIEK